jgi:hypothetical protein
VTLAEFEASLGASRPPDGLSPLLTALWHDGSGDWDTAHHLAQDIESEDAAWVHAYLHRKEGDLSNAAYWYRRANRPVAQRSLKDEWREIVEELFHKTSP